MKAVAACVTDNKSHSQANSKKAVTDAVTANKLHGYRYDKEAVTAKNGNLYAIASDAYIRADYCGNCFKIIPPDNPVALDKVFAKTGNPSYPRGICLTVVCQECFGPKEAIIRACFICGRDIYYRKNFDGERRYHRGLELCSLKCKWTHRNQQTAKKRLKKTKPSLICDCCGLVFTQTRSDSRYCSGKCRQKAYRQRKSCCSSVRPAMKPPPIQDNTTRQAEIF